jgi:hypothetical protein
LTSYTETRTAWLPAEKQLAQDVPFGSVDYIHERAALIYRRRLELLGGHLPAAVQVAQALDAAASSDSNQFFSDPVVRGSIDDLLRTYRAAGERKPADDQLDFLAYYSAHLDELKSDAANTVGSSRQEFLSRPIRYWSDASARTLRDRAFAAMLRQHLPGPRVYAAETETEAIINQAMVLLQELLPVAAHSAMSHLHFIAVDVVDFDNVVGSATISRILGTIFLSRSVLRSPWTIAEAILHECMHLKFVELEHTHSLMARGYSEETSPRIHPPWHSKTVTWPMNRALTAAHVYVALALYSVASEAAVPEFQARYGTCKRSSLLVDPSAAGERARSLIELASRYPESLGQAGRMFLEWMGDILQKLAPGFSVLCKAV